MVYARTLLSLGNGGNVKWQQKLLAVIQLRCNLNVRRIGLICRRIHCLLLKSMKLSLQAPCGRRLIFIPGKAGEFPGRPLPPAGDLDRGMWWSAIRRESDVVSWMEHNQETTTCKSTTSEGHEQRKEFTQRKSSARQDVREVHLMSSTFLHGESSLLLPGFLTPRRWSDSRDVSQSGEQSPYSNCLKTSALKKLPRLHLLYPCGSGFAFEGN